MRLTAQDRVVFTLTNGANLKSLAQAIPSRGQITFLVKKAKINTRTFPAIEIAPAESCFLPEVWLE